jgi:hypothetical protein
MFKANSHHEQRNEIAKQGYKTLFKFQILHSCLAIATLNNF